MICKSINFLIMKRLFILTSIFLFVSNSAFCQHYDIVKELPKFSKLLITSGITAYPSKADTLGAKVVLSGIEADKVNFTLDGETLHIGLSRGFHRDYSVDVYLSYRELSEVKASSSARVSFQDSFTCDSLTLLAESGAQLDLPITAKLIDVTASGGATIRLSGKVSTLNAQARTAGVVSAYDLIADSAYVTVSTKAVAKVYPISLIEASVKSAGSLTFAKSVKKKQVETGIGANILEL